MTKQIARLMILMLILIISVSCTPAATPTEAPPEPTEATVAQPEVTEAPPTEAPTAQPEATEPPAPADPVEFIVWYNSSSAEMITLQTELAEAWEAEQTDPPVVMEFSTWGFEELNNALRLGLDSGTGPDVGYISPGGSHHLAYASAGHLVDLTPFIESRGWDERIPMDVLRYWEAPGSEETYGVAYEVVAVGVYYNADILSSLGIEVPKTYEEFEQALAAVKEAGYIPVSIGGLDAWPLQHIWEQFLHGGVPFENLTALFNLSPDGRWDTPEMLAATQEYEEWARNGYFDPDGMATSVDDALNLFIQGKAVFFIGGTWNNSTLAQNSPFEARFFAMPPMKPEVGNHMGGYTPNNVWSIPVYSKNQELALEYIDYSFSEEVGAALWGLGSIPSHRFEQLPEPLYPIQGDVYQATQDHQTGYYLDTSHPEIGPHIWGVLQELTAGRMTSEEVVASIQAKYEEILASK